MFQDEARFGRITDPKRCWAQKGVRPEVKKQIVREYTYAYGAVSPQDGQSDFLVLPAMDTACMGCFLQEVGKRYPDDFILMFLDGAACHRSKKLQIPKNMQLEAIPPYSPELNPVENVWEELREKWFPNLVFDSMAGVEEQLCRGMLSLERNWEKMRSISGWKWIINHL